MCIFVPLGIDETVEMIRANGGTCVGYKVDISKKEEVYKAADAIRRDVGDVSVPCDRYHSALLSSYFEQPQHWATKQTIYSIYYHFISITNKKLNSNFWTD